MNEQRIAELEAERERLVEDNTEALEVAEDQYALLSAQNGALMAIARNTRRLSEIDQELKQLRSNENS